MSSSSHANAVIKDRTHRETVRFTLTWTIENFRTFRYETKMMYSTGVAMAEMGVDGGCHGRFRIGVRPCFKATEVLDVFLRLTDVDEELSPYVGGEDVQVEFDMRMKTGKTTETEIRRITCPEARTFSSTAHKWGWQDVVTHKDLFGSERRVGLIKDDCVTISMDVVIYKPAKTVQAPRTSVLSSAQRCEQFADRQYKWFSSQQQRDRPSDFDFVLQSSDGKKFRTSRWILMAHSPVFRAMLKHSSKETNTSRCDMTDVDAEAMEIMLDYMYGCQIGKINNTSAEKALIMADKCEMIDLRQVCEELLASNVAVNRAVHYLVLASRRGLETLKAAALNVIPKNMATVLKDGALEEAVQADPDLMQMIMEHCSKKMRVMDEP